MARLAWANLLNNKRFSSDLRTSCESGDATLPEPTWLVTDRTEIERDYDRILFSTPIRRLGDKTQVFPREKNESVRNRLTHTHEVANLARSVAHYIVHGDIGRKIHAELGSDSAALTRVHRDIPAMLTAASLAHDLGNPPFGHQGEEAIRAWVKRNSKGLFRELTGDDYSDVLATPIEERLPLTRHQQLDFELFEGNAQTLRVVTRLQVVNDDLGLNLTYGTLAALMKYTVGADRVDKTSSNSALKKVGYFASESAIAAAIHQQTGLSPGSRHPLTHIMEACDDVAYTILDAEDAVKKQIVSFSDIMSWIQSERADELTKYVYDHADAAHQRHKATKALSPGEVNDVSMQMFRVHAINGLMSAVIHSFCDHYESIMEGEFSGTLVEASKAKTFTKLIKDFDVRHAYRNRKVRELELDGYNTINGLMDFLWRGIVGREKLLQLSPRERKTPFASYAYERISENYRRVFEGTSLTQYRKDNPKLPIRYREIQLLTDMLSGMTDEYAIDLHRELNQYNVGASHAPFS